MNQVVASGIVLRRTNYGEADRIITVLTLNEGKIRLMAKGVRRIKSKLAGGIELFSISDLTYIPGRSDLHRLVSSRLKTNFSNIVTNLDRTMLGYELLKRIDRATEDATDADYYVLMVNTLQALDGDTNLALLELWFDAQLVRIAGHQPNLLTDATGKKLLPDTNYNFDFDNMTFVATQQGSFRPAHIKFLRLVFTVKSPAQLQQIKGVNDVLAPSQSLVLAMRRQFIRI